MDLLLAGKARSEFGRVSLALASHASSNALPRLVFEPDDFHFSVDSMPSVQQQFRDVSGHVELLERKLQDYQNLSESRFDFIGAKIEGLCFSEAMVVSGLDFQLHDAPIQKSDESNPPYSLASKGTGGGSGGDMCPGISSTMFSTTTTTTIAALQAKLSKVVAALEAVQQPAFEVPHPEHGETENADVDPGVLSEISSSVASDDGIHLYQVFDGSLDEVPWSAPTTTATSPWAISSTMAEKIAKDCLVVLRPLSVLEDLDEFWRLLDGALKIQTELERAGHAAIAEELTDNLHALLPVDGNESGSASEG